MKNILAIGLVALLSGCAGTYFTFDRAAQVKVGMTETEVQKIMGKPYLVSAGTNSTEWVWSYADMGSVRVVKFSFDQDGRVSAVPYIPKTFLRGDTNSSPPARSPKGQ